MKNVFDRKLYLVGLKKCKLVGIICGIILIVCNALAPVASLVSGMMNGGNAETTLSASNYAVASPMLLILVPMFFLSMFSFLNHRNESDFYHSIPFKRTCILGSFTAAIFTWVFGTLFASLLLNGILYAVDPAVHFSLLVPLQLFAFFAFISLYVGSFVLLAMTLTGTTVSNCAVSLILLFFVRIISAISIGMLESLVPIIDVAYSPLRFMSTRYWLPAATFRIFYDLSVFRDVGLWVYSAVVLIALYALSVWCFHRRRSESAGKSAVNRVLQHAFRCAFTLPLALLTVFGVMEGAGAAFAVVMVLVTLMFYYLYELVTVKKLRQTLLSTPFLLVPALCCALIVGVCHLTRNTVLRQSYTADQIESVRFYRDSDFLDAFRGRIVYTYELAKTDDLSVSDPEACEIVADTLDNNIRMVRSDSFYGVYIPDSRIENVEIRLKSGKTLRRILRMTSSDVSRIDQLRQESDGYAETYLLLPSDEEITSLSFCENDSEAVRKDADRELWDTFRSEYEELSDEEKLAYKNKYAKDMYVYLDGGGLADKFYFSVSGAFYDSHDVWWTFGDWYYIPPEFERTRSLCAERTQSERDDVRQLIQNFIDGEYDDLFDENAKNTNTRLIFDGDGLWNGKAVFPRGDYEYYYSSTGSTSAENDPKKGKAFFRTLLPYLTDTPEEDNYIDFDFFVLDEENNTWHHYAIFGLSGDIPDELKNALGGHWYNETPVSAILK